MRQILGSTLLFLWASLLTFCLTFPSIALASESLQPDRVNTRVNTIEHHVTSDTSNRVVAVNDAVNGAAIFELHCAGCHVNGGNIVRRGKNLKLKTLQKNGYDTVEAIATITSNGKNNMSAYRDRLTPDEIQTVSAYVLNQAQNNWQP